MTTRLIALCALLLAALPASLQAAEAVGIVTGPKTGTYYAFGRDIAEAVKADKIEVEVKDSEGSIDNIKRINSAENAALGIVQSDVLGFLKRSQNPDSVKMAGKLRMVFPFYNEEVHVLARKSISGFSALAGKRVAVGEEGSGNMLTAINLFSILNIAPAEMRKIPPAEGVVAVLRGELDAVVFVGGKPVRLFKNLEELSLPENQKFAPMLADVHFLALDDAKMLEEYKPATIRKEDYRFVEQDVPTVAVQAVLVSFDFSGNKARCARLGKFAAALKDALPQLKEKGHPKWKEVEADADSGLWRKDSCAWPEGTAAAAKPVADDKKALLDILEKKN
jgi:TRAP transporter TAXI family solute receptor